ncbi:translation elongation factor Ts [Oscillatoria amoena NRMC-F 0135]|nr:MAG: elongation factor Ts [Bacteroidota bacterium]MDL5047852.1 translation elongation factor Ts [Oscillatoria amoena NRMC-F 0135]
MAITAADVNKLRQMTGAGMMDCKKALEEANGDFEGAVDILRKKGQKVSASRAGRDAAEGAVATAITADGKTGVMIALNCETDFVAKNEEYTSTAQKFADLALANLPENLDGLLAIKMEDGRPISEHITDMVGKIGEKIEISSYEKLTGEAIVSYIHLNNKLGVLVALNKPASESVAHAGKDVTMQIAAMNPVALDKEDVSTDTLTREMEIAREQARAEGKPENMLDKIAEGKLNKFYKEATLLNQEFVKDNSKTIRQMLDGVEKGLTVTAFKRIEIGK